VCCSTPSRRRACPIISQRLISSYFIGSTVSPTRVSSPLTLFSRLILFTRLQPCAYFLPRPVPMTRGERHSEEKILKITISMFPYLSLACDCVPYARVRNRPRVIECVIKREPFRPLRITLSLHIVFVRFRATTNPANRVFESIGFFSGVMIAAVGKLRAKWYFLIPTSSFSSGSATGR
jgi:hypothetical protein